MGIISAKYFELNFYIPILKLHCTTNLTVDEGQSDLTYGVEEKHRIISGELTR